MREPIRILQVFAEMNRGGAETMILNLYRHIDRSKIQFDFVVHTQDKCSFDEEIEHLGGKIYRIPKYNGKNHFYYKNEWEKLLNSHPEYRIIHGHVRSTASIYLRIAKNYNLVTIAHSHSTSSGTGVSSVIKNLMQYPIRNISDYFLACSEEAGKWLFGDRITVSSKFNILNNAIETKKFIFNDGVRVAVRTEFGIEGKYVIGHVGRFSPEKNHEFLVDVFKNIHDKVEDSVLLLVGDGPLKESIRSKARKENLEGSIIFAGVRSDVPELFQSMDLFLFPSLFEGLGIVAVEAQAAGLHTIVSEAIPEEAYLTDLIERLSLKDSPSKWAEKILEYSAGYKKKDTSKEIIAAGYDIKENVKWLEEFYIGITQQND